SCHDICKVAREGAALHADYLSGGHGVAREQGEEVGADRRPDFLREVSRSPSAHQRRSLAGADWHGPERGCGFRIRKAHPEMNAILLAGGQDTHLVPLVHTVPKALL